MIGPEHPALSVTDIEPAASSPPFAFLTGSGVAHLRFTVVNLGNTMFPTVTATAYATNAFGRRVKTFAPVHLTAVLPGSSETVVEPPWTPLPFAGPVTVHVEVDGGDVHQQGAASFWVVPWVPLALLVGVVAFLTFRLVRRRRSVTADRGAPRHAVAGTGPTVRAGQGAPEAGDDPLVE